jgi:phosphoserine phosphatase RsbU/P
MDERSDTAAGPTPRQFWEAFRSWDWVEKLVFVLALVSAVFWALGRTNPAAPFLVIFGGFALVRFLRRNLGRILWRLSHRLLVSYMFVAAVPLLLLLALALLGVYFLMGQMAIYAVNAELEHRVLLGGAPETLTSQFLSSLVPQLGSVYALNQQGERVVLSTGRDTLVKKGGEPAVRLGAEDFARGQLPPPVNRFDIELLWTAPVTYQDRSTILVVRSRPSAVLSALFGQKVEYSEFIWVVWLVLTSAFLLVVIASLWVGASITRTVTGAVANLYEGTQQVQQGELGHRIPVRGADQLAELGHSFNLMTEKLDRLIVVEKERERLQSELEIARQVQAKLFPKAVPKLRTLELTGVCYPAQAVSGDYYDFLALPEERVALAIGDVSGKGISAALLMAAIQSVMRTQLTEGASPAPADLVALLNRQLYANTSPEKYATFFFGVYHDATGLLEYTNAGHLPPVMIRGETAQLLEVTGTVVGMFPAYRYQAASAAFDVGDVFVAYTDGIVEPENAYGEMFGEERLTELLLKYRNLEAVEIVARVVEAVREWSGAEQADDMTMVVARRTA